MHIYLVGKLMLIMARFYATEVVKQATCVLVLQPLIDTLQCYSLCSFTQAGKRTTISWCCLGSRLIAIGLLRLIDKFYTEYF